MVSARLCFGKTNGVNRKQLGERIQKPRESLKEFAEDIQSLSFKVYSARPGDGWGKKAVITFSSYVWTKELRDECRLNILIILQMLTI